MYLYEKKVNSKLYSINKQLGPFVDSHNELIASGNIQHSYEELLQMMFDEIAAKLKKYTYLKVKLNV